MKPRERAGQGRAGQPSGLSLSLSLSTTLPAHRAGHSPAPQHRSTAALPPSGDHPLPPLRRSSSPSLPPFLTSPDRAFSFHHPQNAYPIQQHQKAQRSRIGRSWSCRKAQVGGEKRLSFGKRILELQVLQP